MTIVAVKTVRGSYVHSWSVELITSSLVLSAGYVEEVYVQDLLKESLRMKEFEHLNVMGLIGVCLNASHSPCIVLPFMANGNLLSYLKNNREDLVISSEAADDDVCIN